jgi:hypothetical protein
MYAYRSAIRSSRRRKFAGPSEELRLAITFCRRDGGDGPAKLRIPLSLRNVKRFLPKTEEMDRPIDELSRLGFKLTHRGRLSASMRCRRDLFEKIFGTTLTKFQLDTKENYAFHSFYYPEQGAPWNPSRILQGLIDDAYIQWPHIYMARKKPTPSAIPPKVSYFHLEMPQDVSSLLNATRVHREGTTGKGIRVVMIDTGFAHGSHPFFATNGFKSTVVLAPGAVNKKTDPDGHGTGQSTNIFSVAPGATFIGVKVNCDDDECIGATILEGFQTALQYEPHIISVSAGSDLRDENSKMQLSKLPGNLAALEAEILAAIDSGITVVFSAGNGHFSFPGMMPDVISVGGVFVDQRGKSRASDLASAFDSKIYPGRHVPDFCGLVGMKPPADLTSLDNYIMLPIPPGCRLDTLEILRPDEGTGPQDGWAAFSGTSAAAPQIAGVCALLKEKNPQLTPSEVKAILRRTARKVLVGHSNPDSSDDGIPQKAGPGDDGATGAGLIDAFSAWKEV